VSTLSNFVSLHGNLRVEGEGAFGPLLISSSPELFLLLLFLLELFSLLASVLTSFY
jgi:hypothetical protein